MYIQRCRPGCRCGCRCREDVDVDANVDVDAHVDVEVDVDVAVGVDVDVNAEWPESSFPDSVGRRRRTAKSSCGVAGSTSERKMAKFV